MAAIGVGMLVATGCGDDDKEATPAKPTAFSIEATADGKKKALAFPATVKAGLVTMSLKNSDKVARSAQIVRLLGDHSVDEFEDAVAKENAPIPSWIQDGGGVPAAEAGKTRIVTQVLVPGRYAITDDEGPEDGPGYSELGARGEFTVTGPAADVELPAQPATLTADNEGKKYGFTFKGLKPGVNQVRFENTGNQLHHAIIFPINKGKTLADAEALFTSDGPPKGPPPVDFAKGTGTTVIDGGIAQNLELDLPAGRYAVVCFIQDRKGGKSHVAKGMIDELTVE